MKRADIKIGTEYAHARGDWEYENGTADRVRVTGLTQVTQGWGYGTKKVTGVAIEHLNPDGSVRSTGAVQTRRIREEWESYSERWNEIREKRRRNEVARVNATRQRAETLRDAVSTLAAAGFPSQRGYSYDESVSKLLREMFPGYLVDDEGTGVAVNFVGPLGASWSDYIRHNKAFGVPLETLLEVL